ncbi:hypothetical protein [Faecalibaculum rodentium]|uniref:hypothetical protein n=2 Tax=Faecalibaculum rodentium TaxID=1702221 RepID=UPI0026F3C920|nr:hypothetical protein [Faecalibaculum rodentium]
MTKDPFILKGAAGLFRKGQLFQAFHLTLHGTMTVTDPGILLRLINARSRSSDLPGTVLHDLWRDDPGKMKHPLIRRMVEDLKNSEGGWRSMCKIADEYGKKKPKEGLVEGRKEGRRTGIDLQIRRTVENTLKKGRISERDIAMYSGIPPEQVRRIRKAMA